MLIFITGGAGFIGSALVRQLIAETDYSVLNVDKLTYAGSLLSLESVQDCKRYYFEQVDICDSKRIGELFNHYRPDAVIHLAAESHVDRSIDRPANFILTNVIGTFTLLNASYAYWSKLGDKDKQRFRFIHVSTDEVFGSLGSNSFFTESSPYNPRSPYAASKAGSDHLARAWHHTFGLPAIVTNCSNNYGPYQHPEKLIPLMILSAREGRPLPVYGDGKQIRDWVYVYDHCRALRLVMEKGKPGHTYNIGDNNVMTNLEVVKQICSLLDEMLPDSEYKPHEQLISFVQDRPGHDRRYAIDAAKLKQEIGWQAYESFETGLRRTIEWYLEHPQWCESISRKRYWGERLGLIK